MSDIKKIKHYIELTKFDCPINSYQMSVGDSIALTDFAKDDFASAVAAIVLAFEYGRAKGYRAAKAGR